MRFYDYYIQIHDSRNSHKLRKNGRFVTYDVRKLSPIKMSDSTEKHNDSMKGASEPVVCLFETTTKHAHVTVPAQAPSLSPAENAGVKMMGLAKEKAEEMSIDAPQGHDEEYVKHIDTFSKVFAASIQDATTLSACFLSVAWLHRRITARRLTDSREAGHAPGYCSGTSDRVAPTTYTTSTSCSRIMHKVA